MWPVRSARPIILALAALVFASPAVAAGRPNVILILTDDQGYGDLGLHGNPAIRTPNLDRLASQSVTVESFYVSPVCAPTRAALMTGRYNYRTGVTDTYLGRAMMHTNEVTLAEMLRQAGYHTAIFGKWHLGDNYPMRPIEQGFEQSLVHLGGGLCQPAGPPENSYFDPVLNHNGQPIKTHGYCSNVYTDWAVDYIDEHRGEPFFLYLPYNCPHSPFQIAESYVRPYETRNLKPGDFPTAGHPLTSIPADTAKIYGMITNLDENVGRLLDKLKELRLEDSTIVIFLTDNGPNGLRYNAGMRGCKGTVYEGGIRTAFYVRWPAVLRPGNKVDRIAAHVDVTPTLLEACGVAPPKDVRLDGRSILPLLKGQHVDWPDRTIYLQWHRGDAPIHYRQFAARSQGYKLLCAAQTPPGADPAQVPFELYDMRSDPLETKNIASEKPEIVQRMRLGYDAWLAEVSRDRGYDPPPRIVIGTPHENPTTLSRQDWRGPQAGWGSGGLGYWEIAVPQGGTFQITCDVAALRDRGTAYLKLQGRQLNAAVKPGTKRCEFDPLQLTASPTERLECWVVQQSVEKPYGVEFVHVERTK